MHAATHRGMHAAAVKSASPGRPAATAAGTACYGRSAQRKGERANHRDYRY
jgi:hypothetical protein